MLNPSWRDRALLQGVVLVCILALGGASYGQQSEHKKVPGIDKITAGASHQAFNGTIQSINKKDKIINVNTVEGANTEIFPLRTGIRIETAAGDRRNLDSLVPGTNVMVFFDQKNGQRKVTRIEVLGVPAPAKEGKRPAPPS